MEERKYKRIIVLGSTGSGKTVLSNSISKRTGIPVVHLDKEYWLPNWGRPTQDEWINKLSTLVNNEEWIMDGNYIESLDERLKQADLVIVLDIEKNKCIRGVFFRTLKGIFFKRQDLNEGCHDSFNTGYRELITWAKLFKTNYYPALMHKCFQYQNVDIQFFISRKGENFFVKKIFKLK